jgi:hypothetical protein
MQENSNSINLKQEKEQFSQPNTRKAGIQIRTTKSEGIYQLST